MKKIIISLLLISSTFIVFYPFFIKEKTPVPTDALVGMYHPFRDFLHQEYPQGVPFKNYLITDSVRQIIPWKKLAIEKIANGELPLWNPYNFAGTPLMGNIQSSPLYPLNTLLGINLKDTWGLFIYFQIFLGALFLFLFLSFQELDIKACMLASFSWVFSGFFIAWLEWGNILHTALWLPLILLAIDKITSFLKTYNKTFKPVIKWLVVYVLSLSFSFLAGHLQTFFYVFLFSLIYLGFRLISNKLVKLKYILLFTLLLFIVVILTTAQWLPFVRFINVSARDIDISQALTREDWFLPWQHLIGILIPDYFGNPTTLNYWGVWNYGEFALYIGIIPLFFALLAILDFNKSKSIRFYTILLLIFLSFALATPWAKLPYLLKLPLISTAQPSRIIFLIDFCLIILAAYGFNNLFKTKKAGDLKLVKIFSSFIIFTMAFAVIWIVTYFAVKLFGTRDWLNNLSVSKRNLIFPTGIYILFCLGLLFIFILKKRFKKNNLLQQALFLLFFILTFMDLFRFFHKFNPFTPKKWFYPQTKIFDFLKQDKSLYRVATTDRKIMPGNVSTYFKIQAINGYDPLYLKNYAEYIAANERGKADITPPYGFNRIIEPQNINSPLINLLNVKYILSLKDLADEHLKQVYAEGETKVYENKDVFPRVFLVDSFVLAKDNKQVLEYIFEQKVDLKKTAILYNTDLEGLNYNINDNSSLTYDVEIVGYDENRIVLNVNTNKQSILVLSEVFYPSWQAAINDKKTKILPVNFLFRGILVPKGEHQVVFNISI